MATTKIIPEVLDLRGGLPDFSLAATNTVSYLNAGGGNQYNFNGAYGLYGVVNGTFVLSSVSSSHPIAILNNGKTSLISYTGAVNEGSQTGPDGNTYTYYSGDVTITVSGNFDVVSYACKVHGYMGGQNNLIYTNLHSDLGLKIPTGTNTNRPATDVTGMVRNNTNETSASSASCEEYYNGTEWKKINNVAIIPDDFKSITYSGNSSSQSITGTGFQPDLVWIKEEGPNAENHNWYDSSRGIRNFIGSNSSAGNVLGSVQRLNAFDSDGFTLGSDNEINDSASTYKAWCWKVNGGTTTTNTDGTNITSTVQVNVDAGFSIVQWTTPSSFNGSNTVGHGLGSTPDSIFVKRTDGTEDWYVYHKSTGLNQAMRLNTTTGPQAATYLFGTVNSTVFNPNYTSASPMANIAYCFKSIPGYSSIDGYTTGASVKITTGFEPSFMMFKYRSSTGGDWYLQSLSDWDGVTTGSNGGKLIKKYLLANTTNAVQEVSTGGVEIMSDGFYPTNWFDTTNGTIYYAWK